MTGALSPPLGRVLALAILIAIVASLYYLIVAPFHGEYASMRQSIDQLQDELARYQRAARDLPARQADLTALKQRQSSQDGFLQGSNDTLVAAQIQNRIKALSDAAQGDLKSIQILPAEDEGKLRRITVRGQMTATLPGILHIFYGLESAAPLLFLDNVDFRSRTAQLRVRGEEPDSGLLDIQFDVYGYTRPGS
jgi:general secretion pathway protein M